MPSLLPTGKGYIPSVADLISVFADSRSVALVTYLVVKIARSMPFNVTILAEK